MTRAQTWRTALTFALVVVTATGCASADASQLGRQKQPEPAPIGTEPTNTATLFTCKCLAYIPDAKFGDDQPGSACARNAGEAQGLARDACEVPAFLDHCSCGNCETMGEVCVMQGSAAAGMGGMGAAGMGAGGMGAAGSPAP